ncbi:hypothetical protein [Nocardioides jiangxiensis]|uniref:Transcription elongation factor GreA/GreB C-terminal domain-containing protein n=1 Tax=Nocardioides jiangxiensis TaxID=3064524 RepID=A0ABT9B102_9ACTN|nr:hypothetical protein [Nocardioides sp. WY-20]MDO7868080.1 hypothetical protein [Nocardioides sp. WY-20]
MDQAAKQRIKAALVARATEALDALRAQVRDDDAASRIPEGDTYQDDDLSQADEAGDLGALLEISLSRQQAALDAAQALDVAPTDVVGPGAVVCFDGSSYVVGVLSDAFEVDGVTYEGISGDSPVGEAIAGLRAGDTFTVNGQSHTLDTVA